jgi:hypothetical protein
MVASYARYVAGHYPHPSDPAVGVDTVKVYRVLHRIILPEELSQGYSPIDKTLYVPVFVGEFDPDGNLVRFDAAGKPHKGPSVKQDLSLHDDPFLYWYLPIYYANLPEETYYNRMFGNPYVKPLPRDAKLIDCMRIHAGDKPEE